MPFLGINVFDANASACRLTDDRSGEYGVATPGYEEERPTGQSTDLQ